MWVLLATPLVTVFWARAHPRQWGPLASTQMGWDSKSSHRVGELCAPGLGVGGAGNSQTAESRGQALGGRVFQS